MSTVLASPPYTTVEPMIDLYHGVEVTDPYRWLENQESERTRRWIEGQTDYAREILDSLPQRERVRRRVAELLSVEMIGPPYKVGDRYFFLKRDERQDQPVICMREGAHGKDRVLVDPTARGAERPGVGSHRNRLA